MSDERTEWQKFQDAADGGSSQWTPRSAGGGNVRAIGGLIEVKINQAQQAINDLEGSFQQSEASEWDKFHEAARRPATFDEKTEAWKAEIRQRHEVDRVNLKRDILIARALFTAQLVGIWAIFILLLVKM